MRKRVRILILWIIAGVILFAIAVVLTVMLRFGMRTGSLFLKEAIPATFLAVCRDPILIIAFVVAAILVWVAPWEKMMTSKKEDDENPDLVRGRSVESFQRANRRFETNLKARGARLRNDRRNGGHSRGT